MKIPRKVKSQTNTECNFFHKRHNENFLKLRRKIEEAIIYKSDPEGNAVNLAAFLF